MFLFKFKTIMMVFVLHHADNKWKKMCHDVCILNSKKVICITHLYVLPCKYVSLHGEMCFITVSRLLHWILYASDIQWIQCCECVTFFVCAYFVSRNQIHVVVLLLNYVVCLLKSSVPETPISYIMFSWSFENNVTPCTNLFSEKNLE
jgi:hypothetical protein